MQRLILLLTLCTLSSWGMSYAQFKEHTLKHSPVLKRQALEIDKTGIENAITLRAANPMMTLEGSRFDQNNGPKSYEYAVGVSQSVRTPWFMDGLKEKAKATALLSDALRTQGRAGYLKTLEELFTEYVFQSRLLSLLEEEYRLSEHVTQMVKERYESGSENRVAYLQARTQTLSLKTQLYTTRQQRNSLYYQLLAVAGIEKKVSLDKRFIYAVSPQTKNVIIRSPQQQILDAKQKLYRSQLMMNQSGFRNFDLYSSLEQEPDQAVLRVGVNIPLNINNDRSEERMLAKLQMQQTALDKRQLEISLKSQRAMLKSAIRELSQQYNALKTLQKEQKELVALLEAGYKIAKGSLFELMTEKSRLIQTRKALLQTQKMINDQKIALRFLQGDYNE
jgi:outer membrane protein TolC